MPKGHPISVPRTWPGHRDWQEPRDADLEKDFPELAEGWSPGNEGRYHALRQHGCEFDCERNGGPHGCMCP